jgi:hypothetical protein
MAAGNPDSRLSSFAALVRRRSHSCRTDDDNDDEQQTSCAAAGRSDTDKVQILYSAQHCPHGVGMLHSSFIADANTCQRTFIIAVEYTSQNFIII